MVGLGLKPRLFSGCFCIQWPIRSIVAASRSVAARKVKTICKQCQPFKLPASNASSFFFFLRCYVAIFCVRALCPRRRQEEERREEG
jgi:hypothetical protein